VTISAVTFVPESDGMAADTDGSTNVVASVPGRDGTVLRTADYSWDPWEQPEYEERLKESYDVLREELP